VVNNERMISAFRGRAATLLTLLISASSLVAATSTWSGAVTSPPALTSTSSQQKSPIVTALAGFAKILYDADVVLMWMGA
jgi:hypothetical protein